MRLRDKVSALIPFVLKRDLRQVQSELQTYRHAFETTTADRDRIAGKMETYRHAFETTAADRDRIAADIETYRYAFETTAADRDRLNRLLSETTIPRVDHQGDDERHAFEAACENEKYGRPQKAIEVCEQALSETTSSHLDLCMARNLFTLASNGDERYAFPACLYALDGIRKRLSPQADAQFAVDIVRWASSHFANAHRIHPRSSVTDDVVTDLKAVRDLLTAEKVVAGSEALFQSARLVPTYGRTKQSLRREAIFHLAQLYSDIDAEEALSLLLRHDYPMPAGFDSQLYEDYLLTSAIAGHRQKRARRQGVPAFLITCLPRSASEFLCYNLAEALDAPVVRVSVGRPFHVCAYSGWVRQALFGGCITHDHFAATEQNVRELTAAGAERIAVLVRDPRAVAWSLMKMNESWYDGEPEDNLRVSALRETYQVSSSEEARFFFLLQRACEWMKGWLSIAEHRQFSLQVHVARFQELTRDTSTAIRELVDFFGAPELFNAINTRFSNAAHRGGRASSNLRSGNDDEWRGGFSYDFQERAWNTIPSVVKDALELRR